MQDATRAVFDVWQEVEMNVYVDDKKVHVQTQTEAMDAVRSVHGELKKQMDMSN